MTVAEASWVERALGRPEHIPPLPRLTGMRVLVTGAEGSLGRALCPLLRELDAAAVFETDVVDYDRRLDVRDREAVHYWARVLDPDLIFHLAGAKHAPAGEADPYAVCVTNAVGTANVVSTGRPVVLASTGKAANPETAYGASKLIAERIVLNAGGSVARFYNVVETDGNVFDIWARLPDDAAIPFTDCSRYFISIREALALLVWAARYPGRWVVDVPVPRDLLYVAVDVYPDRDVVRIPPRRGDRIHEPRTAQHETWILNAVMPFARVTSPHDDAG